MMEKELTTVGVRVETGVPLSLRRLGGSLALPGTIEYK
jgi:hypothetical protein